MCLGLALFPAVPPIFRGSTIVFNSFNFLNSFNSSCQRNHPLPFGEG